MTFEKRPGDQLIKCSTICIKNHFDIRRQILKIYIFGFAGYDQVNIEIPDSFD